MISGHDNTSSKIGFLFNHDAAHQAPHVIPILAAYAAKRPQDEIRAYVSDAAMRQTIEAGLDPAINARLHWIDLQLPFPLSQTARVLDVAMPASRVTRLHWSWKQFEDLDALIAPERTCLILKRKAGMSHVKFIHVRHGAGDRAIGFHKSFRHFDLLLLQGEKYSRRLKETGGLDQNEYAKIGYPKFDDLETHQWAENFFDNDNPVVFYNPHFAPGLSSWYEWGTHILDYFADNPDLNVIFAPHIMLFKKGVHIAPETKRMAFRRDLSPRYAQCKNIHIDIDSARLLDMTYTLNSDLYLGDVSSQVVEFLVKPRPCVFLNPYNLDGNRLGLEFWRLGDVLKSIDDLDHTIRDRLKGEHRFKDAQADYFADTFDLTQTPSAQRAANAIEEFMVKTKS